MVLQNPPIIYTHPVVSQEFNAFIFRVKQSEMKNEPVSVYQSTRSNIPKGLNIQRYCYERMKCRVNAFWK